MAQISLLLLVSCCVAVAYAGAPLFNAHFDTTVPGEYLVTLKTGEYSLKTSTFSQLEILDSFHIGDWRALHVRVEEQSFGLLAEDENVEFIEANANEFHATCEEQSTGSRIWGLTRLSHQKPNYNFDNYQYSDEGQGVNAYVIDTGIYSEHRDFEGRARHGFTAPSIREPEGDLNGHGTHCAGTVGGATYGVAKKCNLIGVKVLNARGSGSTSDVAAGINYVANQHRRGDKSVINLSLGMSGTSPTTEGALEAAIRAGVHAAVAAGNSNADACRYSPARVGPAITVASSTKSDALSSFTNYGKCTDVVAPGSSILSTYIGSPTTTRTLSGTSMASPHVCGWVARYLSTVSASTTPAQVKQAIHESGIHNKLSIGSRQRETPNVLPFAAC